VSPIQPLFQGVSALDTSRQNRKPLQLNHALKSALIQLLLESDNPGSITVSEITDRAGFNRCSFYFHYKNKNGLIDDLFDDALKGISDSLREPLNVHKEVLISEVSNPTATMLLNHVEKNQMLFKALTKISPRPDLFDRIESMLWRLLNDEFVLNKGSQDQNVDYEINIAFHITSLTGVIRYWVATDFQVSADYIIEQIIVNTKLSPTSLIAKK